MAAPAFVDCHSHVLPSGDDGAQSHEEGVDLCRRAAEHGTAVLFATPHVWPHMPLTEERERAAREAYAALAPEAGLELRLGYELTPDVPLLDEDPRRYVLAGTDAVLLEIPFVGGAGLFLRVAEHIEAAGLRVVVGHPERTEAVAERPALADELAERGWLLQVNATSLTGYHGQEMEERGWRLLESGVASLVASDGHRLARPPFLDEAYRLARHRLGADEAIRFFDGSALLGAAARESRAA